MKGRAACVTCGEDTVWIRRKGGWQLPRGWEEREHGITCPDCIVEGRQPAPLTVRWMPGTGPPKPKPQPRRERTTTGSPLATRDEAARTRVAKLLAERPERNTRWVSDLANVHERVVVEVRTRLEQEGAIPMLDRLVGSTGRWQRRHRRRAA